MVMGQGRDHWPQESVLHAHTQHPATKHQAGDLAIPDNRRAHQAMIAEAVLHPAENIRAAGSFSSASSSATEYLAPVALNWVVRWNSSDTRARSSPAKGRVTSVTCRGRRRSLFR